MFDEQWRRFVIKMATCSGKTRVMKAETGGLEDLDLPLKMERLRLWCEDINQQRNEKRFDFVFWMKTVFKNTNRLSFSNWS
jgi:type III restriction enzyme